MSDADQGAITREIEGAFFRAANYGYSSALSDFIRNTPVQMDRSSIAGRALVEGRIVQISDVKADPEYTFSPALDSGDFRTALGVPMLRDGIPIGALSLTRKDVRPFTDKQIELASTFADQAAIAIENVRLFDELRQRTDDLSASLEQQTATSEVLKVISSSPGDLESVFTAMLENATRVCEAKHGFLFRADGDGFRVAATLGERTTFIEQMKNRALKPGPLTPIGRVKLTKQIVHVPDLSKDQCYLARDPLIVSAVEQGGVRSVLIVPMLKDDELIGAIGMHRRDLRPFTDKQIELLTNFAAQAVIAIENTRLLNELRESLEQQTATSEVLKVISSSQGDLDPVFQAMLENAVRICDASFGMLFRVKDGLVSADAMVGVPPQFAEFWHRGPQRPGPRTALGRIVEEKQTVHIADVRTEAAYVEGEPVFVAAVNLGGFRTLLNVPMLKDNELIGTFAIYRQEVRLFSDKEVELLSNFAAQAVIAIENARLLNELRQRTDDLSESLEQQTATSEVLKVISSSPGDLEPVFQAMLANATRICGAKFGVLFRYEDGTFHAAAMLNAPQAFVEFHRQRGPFQPPAGSPLDRLLKTGGPVYTADEAAEPNPGTPARLGGARSLVVVPMRKESRLVGAIIIYHQEVRPFSDKQIELLTNFAAQAVIAIENTRLLNELREVTGATDGNGRGPQGHQLLAWRTRTGIQCHFGECDPYMRSKIRHTLFAQRRRILRDSFSQRPSGFRRCAKKQGAPPRSRQHARPRGPD